jgi:PadR family transcriptional regulator PadR
MNTDNAIQQMKKGVLELCVLSVLSAHDEVYPKNIVDELKKAGMDIVEGTLYPMLTRLKNSGHLTYTFKESKTGPPRKYYRLTDLGKSFLEELRREWNDFTQSVDKVVNPILEELVLNDSQTKTPKGSKKPASTEEAA